MRLVGRASRLIRSSRALREPLRTVLTGIGVHRTGAKSDIAIISCRRSGSTWLMEMLAAQPRMRYVNEPFEQAYFARNGLPTGLESQLPAMQTKVVHVAPEHEQQFRRYLRDPRATRIMGPYDLFSPTWHPVTDRRVWKIVNATAIAKWIDDQQLGFDMVYLLRHPVPTVLSMASSVALRAEANLRNPAFVSQFLEPSQEELGWELLRRGSTMQRFALEWCLDSMVPFRAVATGGRDWLVMTYEELNLSPRDSVGLLSDRLALTRPDKLLERMQVPSQSTAYGRIGAVAREDALRRISRWVDKVSDGALWEIFEVIDAFGIDAYVPDSPLARPRWLHFPETLSGI